MQRHLNMSWKIVPPPSHFLLIIGPSQRDQDSVHIGQGEERGQRRKIEKKMQGTAVVLEKVGREWGKREGELQQKSGKRA